MAQTIEAIIDQDGNIHLLEPIHLPASGRALATILEETARTTSETAFLSEETLAEYWMKPEKDKAWSHLSSAE